MSLETWKAEFYPVEAASEEALADPIRHSLVKWTGLLQENLNKHAVFVSEHMLKEGGGGWLPISSATCALCVTYEEICCNGCPLDMANKTCVTGVNNPWSIWVEDGDPKPMIEALKYEALVELL